MSDGTQAATSEPQWKTQDFSKVKVGIALNTMDFAPVPFMEQAIACEERGFESIWVPQHSHVTVTGPRNYRVTDEVAAIMAHMSDPFVLLSAAAAVTKKIRIGTEIALLAEYEPFCFAHMASTLDMVSGGRLELGVGYGGNQLEAENRGVVFNDRITVLREKALAVKELWHNEIASFDGKYVKFAPSRQWPKPVQKPNPPLHLGVVADKNMVEAVQYFDGYMPNIATYSIEQVRNKLKLLEETAKKYGRDPKTINRTAFRGFRSVLVEVPMTHVDLHRPVPREDFAKMCVNQRDLEIYQELGINRINVGLPFAPNRDEFYFVLDTLAEKLVK